MNNQLLLIPRMSEKAYGLSQSQSVYVFMIPKNTTADMVKRAVSEQFKVSVVKVNTGYLPPKAKRSFREGGRRFSRGTQPAVKKAYVTLKKGDSIPIFANEEKEKKPVAVKKGKK